MLNTVLQLDLLKKDWFFVRALQESNLTNFAGETNFLLINLYKITRSKPCKAAAEAASAESSHGGKCQIVITVLNTCMDMIIGRY